MTQIEQQLHECEQQIEADRTDLNDAVLRLEREISSRSWLTEGRGSYEWNDDRYREEFSAASKAILEAIAPLQRMRTSWQSCPKTTEEVAKARIDLRAKLAQLEQELASLRNIAGDNLCRFDMDSAKAEARALPEAEFLESCRRFRQQIADERGEVSGCRTIAQLEQRVKDVEQERDRIDHEWALCCRTLEKVSKERDHWKQRFEEWQRAGMAAGFIFGESRDGLLVEKNEKLACEIALCRAEDVEQERDRLRDLITRRSGASSWEEFTSGLDLTERTPAEIIQELRQERDRLMNALKDIAIATPRWSEGGGFAGGETWHGFSQRLIKHAQAALSGEPSKSMKGGDASADAPPSSASEASRG